MVFQVDKKVSFLKQMGSFFSQKTLPFRGPAGEATGEREGLKATCEKAPKSPTLTRSKCDGRSYAEAVRAGPETSAMSKLSVSGAAWKFCEAPKDEEMCMQERVQEPRRDRQGTG